MARTQRGRPGVSEPPQGVGMTEPLAAGGRVEKSPVRAGEFWALAAARLPFAQQMHVSGRDQSAVHEDRQKNARTRSQLLDVDVSPSLAQRHGP